MCRRLWTLWTKGSFRIIEESISWRKWIISVISSFVLRCNQRALTSQTFFPEYNQCPGVRLKCGTEELELGYKDKPSRQLVLNGFSRVYKQWIHRLQQICQSCLREYLEESCSTGTTHSLKKRSKNCHMRRKIACNCRWIPVKDQLFP